MKVEKLMTPQPRCCSADDTLERAAQLMWDGDFGCLPVCASDGSGRVVGMITDRDICMSALFQSKPLRDLPVTSAMSKRVVSCKPQDTLEDVERIMREAQVRRLPVVDERGVLAGIVGLADIAREAARERHIGTRDVTDSEVRETLYGICKSHHERVAA